MAYRKNKQAIASKPTGNQYQKAYQNGKKAYHDGNMELAEFYFIQASDSAKYSLRAIQCLFSVYLKKGRYDLARNLLDRHSIPMHQTIYDYKYGHLEEVELNYNKSSTYYENCIDDSNLGNKAYFELAKLNLQLGNVEQAQYQLNYLKEYQIKNEYLKIAILFQQIYSYIIIKEYDKALRILKSIDQEKLSIARKREYNIMYMLILYGLDKLSKHNRYSSDYYYKLLINNDEKVLLSRINKEQQVKDKPSRIKFAECVNLEELLSISREKIENMNGRYRRQSEIYILPTEEPIGWCKGTPTDKLCVETILNTKTISNIYPIFVSPNYNAEGHDTSRVLKRTREKHQKH